MKIYTRYFALSLMIFSSALCQAALQNGKFEVAITKGQSSLINPQSIKEPVVRGKLFEQGYKVETNKDSTVELCLSNGSTILVNPETLLEIRTFRQVASDLIVQGAYQKLDKEPSPSVVEIFVVKGKIIGEARKLNPQSSFTIKSPAGVARIRGTVYSVAYERNESDSTGNMEVACVKGSVEVTVNGSDSGSQPVEPGTKMISKTPLVDSPEDKRVPAELVKIVIPAAVSNSPQVSLPSTEGLVVGGEIKAPGIPSGVKVVSIEDGKITFSEPITLAAGTEIIIDPPSLPSPPPPPPLTAPTITFSKLGQDEVKTIADDLSKGTSLPTAIKDEVKTIADNTPPVVPPAPKDGTSSDKTSTEKTDSPTETTNTNNGGSAGTGGVNNVIDAISNTIQETIEKENQKNPSPTQ